MEIELKYLCSKKTADSIFETEVGSCERLSFKTMKALYLDTAEEAIRDAKLTYRIRQEGGKYFATVKYGSSKPTGGALHKRNEINIEVDEDFFDMPRIDIFEDCDIYKLLDKAVGGQYSDDMGVMRPIKKLQPKITMDFMRTECEVVIGEDGRTAAIISYDEGEISASGKSESISELEIELISGSEDDLIDFGRRLQEKYSLSAGIKSKYARGLKLIQPKKDKKIKK